MEPYTREKVVLKVVPTQLLVFDHGPCRQTDRETAGARRWSKMQTVGECVERLHILLMSEKWKCIS
jgi:hypothetical protein